MDSHPAIADNTREPKTGDPSEESDKTEITADIAKPVINNTISKVNLDGQKTTKRASARIDRESRPLYVQSGTDSPEDQADSYDEASPAKRTKTERSYRATV